jgi:hypothetical protein
MGVTTYTGLYKIYGRRRLKVISQLGRFHLNNDKVLLDFGCGNKELKNYVFSMQYNGFDIDPVLTTIKDWQSLKIHTFVANDVLCYFTRKELSELFKILKKHETIEQIIIGVAIQNNLSKFFKFLFGKKNAHDGTISNYPVQRIAITENFKIKKIKRIFWVSELYLLEKIN